MIKAWFAPHIVFPPEQFRYYLLFAVNSQVVSWAVHRNSPPIHDFNRFPAMIQLKPGIPPSALAKPRKPSDRQSTRPSKTKSSGLRFERVFSDATTQPFDQVEWERRTAEITDDSGKVIFKQENVEVPKSWSALATKIAVSKYFYGDVAHGTDPSKGGRETSVRQLVHRVTRTITDWGMADGYFADADAAEIFYDELTWLCLNQHGAFNSPVWFNIGLYHQYGSGKAQARAIIFTIAKLAWWSGRRPNTNTRKAARVSFNRSMTRWKTSCV